MADWVVVINLGARKLRTIKHLSASTLKGLLPNHNLPCGSSKNFPISLVYWRSFDYLNTARNANFALQVSN